MDLQDIPQSSDLDHPTSLYVVVHQGLNERIRALAHLQTRQTRVTFVSHRDATIGSAECVQVKPWPNPLGILRYVGLNHLKQQLDALVYFPTREKLYVWPAVRYLARRVRTDLAAGRRVVVLTSLPAHAVALVGMQLKSQYPQIRWVVDWRDLWTYDESYFNRVALWHQKRARALEEKIVASCDLNVTTNTHAAEVLASLHPKAIGRIKAVTHHFMAADDALGSDATATIQPEQPVRLVYMGGMFKSSKVPGKRLLDALHEVRAQTDKKIELHLYGRQSPEFNAIREDHIDYGLTLHSYIPPTSVLDELRRYDLLVLLLDDSPNSRVVMHQKLPGYLLSGRPILAIVPGDSAVARTVKETGTGWVIPSGSDWVTGIQGVVAEFRAGKNVPDRNEDAIAKFSWQHVSTHWRAALGLPVDACDP